MLPDGEKTLFKTYVPAYGYFISHNIHVKVLANEQSQSNNVHNLSNKQIYDLAKYDIAYHHDAILISTRDRYYNYINWFIRHYPNEDLNLRLSKTKLPTKSLREQLVLVLRRFHPWKEDLDKFVLRTQESGIFGAWGEKPLLVDVDSNPNRQNYTQRNLKDSELRLDMVINFLIFLAIGLAISFQIFILEAVRSIMKFYDLPYRMPLRRNCKQFDFKLTVFICIVSMVTLPICYFTSHSLFPAVVSFLRHVPTNDHSIDLIEAIGMDKEGNTDIRGTIAMWK